MSKLFSRFFPTRQSDEKLSQARIEAFCNPRADQIDIREFESWPADGKLRTLLYAEGTGLIRIHLYQTRQRFVFVTYQYSPSLRRSFLKTAAAGRILPLKLLTRMMTLKPERCDKAFLNLLESRGFHLHCAPFDHSLTSYLPTDGIYGETLESLVGDVRANRFVGRALGEMPSIDLICALANYDIVLETQGLPSTVKYATFEGADGSVMIDSNAPAREGASAKIASFATPPLRLEAAHSSSRRA